MNNTSRPSFSEDGQQAQDISDSMQHLTVESLQHWLLCQLAERLEVGVQEIDINEPFASYGLSSRDAVMLSGDLGELLGKTLPETLFWDYPTIKSLSRYLVHADAVINPIQQPRPEEKNSNYQQEPIAIVGISCRFPGASDLERFWQLLLHEVDAIIEVPSDRWDAQQFYSEDPLASGKMKTRWGGFLKQIDQFDPHFFGISPKEARYIDPQQRLLLEVAWEALEDAGHDVTRLAGSRTGVFIGIATSDYGQTQLSDPSLCNAYINTGSAPSIAANRLSYTWDLCGPSLAIDTACSSSLVAVHLACQSLRRGESTLALAGGVNVILSPMVTINMSKAEVIAPDGRCKTFDAHADGYVRSEGAGVLVLKPLAQARADGDHIYAVIRGSAINQDGRTNGLMAPNGKAQEQVVLDACTAAGITPGQLQYVETHGTGTYLGDPIEVKALGSVLSLGRAADTSCAIGSVKTNIGHLEAAAGIAGIIKVALALKHQTLPASLHFHEPNPLIPFTTLPLHVQQHTTPWPDHGGAKALASVSSFGFGGTNAHIVLEEAPESVPPSVEEKPHLLVLSAKTPTALAKTADSLSTYLKQHPQVSLTDVALTLQTGRKAFPYRYAFVCRQHEDALQTLSQPNSVQSETDNMQALQDPWVIFMFPGGGAQYVKMTEELYQTVAPFRQVVDQCADLLNPILEMDIRTLLYPDAASISKAAEQLKQIYLMQTALFVVEYALACTLQTWGIVPKAMIGHSIGEYVAACLAGVFSLEDALRLVVMRGRFMQGTPSGAMLSISLSIAALEEVLLSNPDLSVAALNAPNLTVLSGPVQTIQAVYTQLQQREIECRLLLVSQAAHSAMMEPIVGTLADEVAKVELHAPTIPYLSNVTGTWITVAEATDPQYWGKHLRLPVRFNDGVQKLIQQPAPVFIEVGPGSTLTTLVKQCVQPDAYRALVTTVRHPQVQNSDLVVLLHALGQLWVKGVAIHWETMPWSAMARRVSLPCYPFERQRYWHEGAAQSSRIHTPSSPSDPVGKRQELDRWFYVPSWKRSALPPQNGGAGQVRSLRSTSESWLLFLDEYGIGEQLARYLQKSAGQAVITVANGDHFAYCGNNRYMINSQHREDYEALLQELTTRECLPQRIVHLWSVQPLEHTSQMPTEAALTSALPACLYSLLFVAQTFGMLASTQPLRLSVVTIAMQEVIGQDAINPLASLVLGPCRVLPTEYPGMICQNIDLDLSIRPDLTLAHDGTDLTTQTLYCLTNELLAEQCEPVVAYRANYRWVQQIEAVTIKRIGQQPALLRTHGVYLITGGLGGVGLELAMYLAQRTQGTLILLGRSSMLARDEWEQWLATHDDDETSQKIRKIQQIEQLGARVYIAQADVADEEQMRTVVAAAMRDCGAINGVIHAAGIPGGGVIQRKTPEEASRVIVPKVQGALVLHKLFQPSALDFMVYCSSMVALIGSVGQADYCAANAVLDALATSRQRTGLTIAINWDAWLGIGMAVIDNLPPGLREWSAKTFELGMLPHEGHEVFERILQAGMCRVIVSTQDFQDQVRQVDTLRELFTQQLLQQHGKPQSLQPRPALVTSYVAPTNLQEEKLATIWQELLGFERVGIHDDFFELGGHSLMSTQLVARINKEFQVSLSAKMLFERTTIARLAEYLVQAQPEVLPIQRVSREQPLPLSFEQQRLWLVNQVDPQSSAYNVPGCIRLSGQCDTVILKRSIEEILRRHEVLRSTFAEEGGLPVQIIAPPQAIDLPLIVLVDLPEEEKSARIRACEQQIIHQPFDLGRGPLFRVALVQVQANEHILFLAVHHIAADGLSTVILMQELVALYRAYMQGLDSPLPELAIQYGDYAVWQQKRLQGDTLNKMIHYWREQLAGARPPALRTDYPRSALQSMRGSHEFFRLDAETTRSVKQLSQQYGVTPFMSLLAAFQILLARYCEQEDIVVGTDVANRGSTELEQLIGFFVNIVVVRTQIRGNASFVEVLEQVRERLLGAYAHQEVPFEKVVDALQLPRQGVRTPLVQVLFVSSPSLRPIAFPDLQIQLQELYTPNAKFDIAVFLREVGDELEGFMNYSTDLYEANTIARLAQHYVVLLQKLLAQPQAAVHTLEFISAQEKEQRMQQLQEQKINNRKKLKIARGKEIEAVISSDH